PPPQSAKPQLHNSETLNDEVGELTAELEALRAAYEQYFLGIERRPPILRHDALKRRVNAVQTTTVRQVAAKFKAQTLNAKMLTYERLWARTLKEIEDGTYRRDLFKARLHRKERQDEDKPPPPPKDALNEGAKPPPPPKDALAGAKPLPKPGAAPA